MLNRSHVVRPVYLALLLGVSTFIITGSAQAQSSVPFVTDEVAILHLFARIADGPKVASWAVRTSELKASGFTPEQIAVTVQAANSFMAAIQPLAAQAAAVHGSLKAKTVSLSAGKQQLLNLDQVRANLVIAALGQLQSTLGSEGWFKFETYLTTTVKPTIVVAP